MWWFNIDPRVSLAAIAIAAICAITFGLSVGVVTESGCRQAPTVTCPAGKSPVVTAVDGGWLVRCEVKP